MSWPGVAVSGLQPVSQIRHDLRACIWAGLSAGCGQRVFGTHGAGPPGTRKFSERMRQWPAPIRFPRGLK
jgi:hypothetical protein